MLQNLEKKSRVQDGIFFRVLRTFNIMLLFYSSLICYKIYVQKVVNKSNASLGGNHLILWVFLPL